jgi:glycosyltransferase involved in cell wall biosynthesis
VNIGIVSKSVDQQGGAEIYLLECMRRWQKKADITLYSTSIDLQLLVDHGIDTSRLIHVLLPSFEGRDRRPFSLLEDLMILPRLWENKLHKHDVYFLNGCPAQIMRCSPSVFMCHEPLRMLYDLRYLGEYVDGDEETSIHVYPEQAYRRAPVLEMDAQMGLLESLDRGTIFDRMAVNSQNMARYAENVYGRRPDVIAYPGVNVCEEPGGPTAGKRAVFVGRLWPHKRLELVIKAIALVPDGNLDIVGQGPDRDKLEALAARLGVSDRVVFHGRLPQRDVERIYREATCGVYVPLREPFGMMPLEAAAAGLPVVVSPEGGYMEILGDHGAIVAQPNPKSIARGLDRLFSNPTFAAKMGRQAAAAVANHTWDRTADELYELLEDATRVRKLPVQSTTTDRPLLGAHYYPWYNAGSPTRHWNENSEYSGVTDRPQQGCYTSQDDETIQHHLDLAEEGGLDFLIINLEIGSTGVNAQDLEATKRMVAAAEARNGRVRVSVMLSIGTVLENPVRTALHDIQKLAESSSWLHHRGKPMLWIFFSNNLLGCFFTNRSMLEVECARFNVVAAGAISLPRCLPMSLQQFIVGWCLYKPFRYADATESIAYATSCYARHVNHGQDPIRIFAVSPGYDDRHLTGDARQSGDARRVDRADGRIYESMLHAAIQASPRPEMVVITSFNEFHENTHIEPSVNYGDRFIRLSAEFSRALKTRRDDWPGDFASPASTASRGYDQHFQELSATDVPEPATRQKGERGLTKQFRTAVIHVGTDKTGSTALQTSMDAMRNAFLRRRKVAYLPRPVHHMLGSHFSAEPERLEFNVAEGFSSRSAIRERDRAYLTDVERFLQTAGECETLFLSFEGFYSLAEETLDSLVAWASSHAESVTALMYVRQPHSYAVSALSQRVFSGQAATATKPLRRVNISRVLTRLEHAFGQGRVLVRAYEASQLIGGDIVSDCLHAIGAEDIIGTPDYVRGGQINTQMSREAATFGKALMTALTEGGAKLPDRTSWRKCRDLIAAMPGHRITLTPKQAAELSDATQSDLSLLKAAYGIEFQEPASKYVEDSDLSAETAMITEIAKVVATMIPH